MGDEQVTEEQEKIIATVKQISQMLQNGKMPLELCPVSDLKTVLYLALCYQDNTSLAEQASKKFENMLEKEMIKGDNSQCEELVEFAALCMECVFDMKDYYESRETNENVLYHNIMKHYRENTIDEKFLEEHTYQSLVEVKKKGEIGLFKEVSQCVYAVALERIRKKKTKKIVFLLKDSAEWSCEELYRRISEKPEIEIQIAVTPFGVGTQQTITNTYINTIEYFKNRGDNVIGMYELYQGRYRSWKEIGMPDIVFHLNPHHGALPDNCDICNFPLSILNIYIPYGIMTYGNVEHQFNQMSHALYWKIFCETPLHKKMAEKYSDIGDTNVVNSGYVKMDSVYRTEKVVEDKIWKVSPLADRKRVKKIIYAPHWSVKNAFTGFGNFDKIYKEIYRYARDSEEITSWVFRPHPMLRAGAVQYGVFSSEKEYDDYLNMWDQLPNAQVMESGMYIDIFKTSDAMILDSVSFLTEYLYMHKPMLFLTRERNTFNDFGQELMKVLYKVDGGDFLGIKKFVEEVVLNGKDIMIEDRETFFKNNLDYRKQNGMLASEYICEYLKKQLYGIEEFEKHEI